MKKLTLLLAVSLTACVEVEPSLPLTGVGIWQHECNSVASEAYDDQGTSSNEVITITPENHYKRSTVHYTNLYCQGGDALYEDVIFEDNIAFNDSVDPSELLEPNGRERRLTFDSGATVVHEFTTFHGVFGDPLYDILIDFTVDDEGLLVREFSNYYIGAVK